MSLLRKIIAALMVITFIPVAFMGAFALGVIETYLNPDFYQSKQFEELFYEVIVEEISSQLISSQPELDEFLEPEDIMEEVKIVIPPEMISNAIADVFNQLEQIPLPDEIIISTEELKNNLPLVADRIFAEITPDLPIDTSALEEEFQQELIDYIPPRIILPLSELPDNARQGIVIVLLGTHHATTSFLTTLIIHIVTIGFLIWKPFKSSLRWMGHPLIYSGVLLIGFLHLIRTAAPQVHSLAAITIQPISEFMYLWAWGYVAIGVGAIIASFFLPKQQDERENQVQ